MTFNEIPIACARAAETLISLGGIKNVDCSGLKKGIEDYYNRKRCSFAFVCIVAKMGRAAASAKGENEKEREIVWESQA